ncbi:DUF3373 family protein, partial [Thermodesulfobacteriota bacterium]
QGAVSGDSDLLTLKEDVEELSEMMGVVEKRSLLDRVQMNAELRTRCDWFTFRDDKTNHDESVDALFSNRFRLNLKSKVSDRLVLHARLTAFYNWNDNSVASYPRITSFNRSRHPDDNDIEVDRVYADYFFNVGKVPMSLTFGRLPTTDGLPTNLREDTARKSAYPAIAWDTEMDGLALNIGLESLISLKDSTLRFVYARLVEDGDDVLYRRSSYDMNDIDVYFAQFETGFARLPGAIFILNVMYAPEWIGGDARPMGLTPIDIQGELGSIFKFAAYFQAERFLGSNWDLFAGYSYIDFDGNGKDVWGALGGLIKVETRLNDGNGYGFHVGCRYNIPWKVLNRAKFGVEYNYNSKWHLVPNYGAEDPLRKLMNHGYAWDFYYIQPIDKNFKVRLGYTYMQKRYTGDSPNAVPERTDQQITNAYILLDAKF